MELNCNITNKLTKELTPSETKFLLLLNNYVSYEDCIVRENKSRESAVVTVAELPKLLNMSENTTRKYIKSLNDKGIISIAETGSILPEYKNKIKKMITVNPNIYFNGEKTNEFCNRLFSRSGW